MKEILLCSKNIDGKTITKKVPENVLSLYEKIGWKIVKENKEEPIEKDSIEEKPKNKSYLKERDK